MPVTVIPDDYPVVMATSAAYQRFTANNPLSYYDSLPGSEDAQIDRIRDFEVVINIRSSSKFTERVFASCPRMKLLSIWGTGTDNIDLTAAQRHGIVVTNTPAVTAVSIAEHSLMLTLAVARHVVALHQQVVGGQWPRGHMMQLRGKTLGIIGLGAIGREFARLGEAIGMNVITWTMHPDPQRGFRHVELETLLRDGDVVSLHLRLSPETTGFLGEREFGIMKQSAIFLQYGTRADRARSGLD